MQESGPGIKQWASVRASEAVEETGTVSTEQTIETRSEIFGAATHKGTEARRTTGPLLATQGYVVGIEISGSGSRQSIALADLQGNILQRVRRPLDYIPDAATVLTLLDEMLDEVQAAVREERVPNGNGGRILRVGVAVGGLVDTRTGVVQTLHHAHGWDFFPLQDALAERLDIPCIIDNNANASALAEAQYGAGTLVDGGTRKAGKGLLYIGLGRGIGGGLVLDGRIYHGISGTAGEIGHMQVKEDGPKCSCGGYGHLEAIASAPAIVRTMIGLSVEYPETEKAIRRMTGGRAERITAAQVFALAAQGDGVAQRIVDDVHTYLGIALTNIVHFINPGIIILGGQVAQVGDLLLQPLQERVQQLCMPGVRQSVQIVQGRLGSEANITGAVTLALQDL